MQGSRFHLEMKPLLQMNEEMEMKWTIDQFEGFGNETKPKNKPKNENRNEQANGNETDCGNERSVRNEERFRNERWK